MKKAKKLPLLLVFVLPILLYGQSVTTWSYQDSATGTLLNPAATVQVNAKRYLQVFQSGHLILTDSSHNILKSNRFTSPTMGYRSRLFAGVSGGNYLVTVPFNTSGNPMNPILVSLDSNLQMNWVRQIAPPPTYNIHVAGVSNSNGALVATEGGFLSYLDHSGNPIWNKQFPGVRFFSVINAAQNGFYAGGQVNNGNYRVPILVRLDSLGDTLWTKSYIPTQSPVVLPNFNQLHQRPDGSIAGFGSDGRLMTMLLDSAGNFQYYKQWGMIDFYGDLQVIQDKKGGYYIGTNWYDWGGGMVFTDYTSVSYVDESLSFCWSVLLQPIGFGGMIMHPDSNVVVFGGNKGMNIGRGGEIACNVSLLYHYPPTYHSPLQEQRGRQVNSGYTPAISSFTQQPGTVAILNECACADSSTHTGPGYSYTLQQDTFFFQALDTSGKQFHWFFGEDMQVSHGPNPVVVFPDTQLRKVCLTLYDSNWLLGLDSCGIKRYCQSVNPPCGSVSSLFQANPSGFSLNAISLGGGNQWLWDFGDGNSSAAQNPSHTYALPGSYLVCLIASDSCASDTSCQLVQVCGTSQPSFSTQQLNPYQFQFSSTSTGPIQYQYWSVPGVHNSGNPVANINFPGPGTYVLTLTLVDSCGQSFSTDTTMVFCSNPVAAFTYSGTGLSYTFSDLSSGSIDTWAWDFGDGNTSSLQNPLHTYASSGNYLVNLVVTDSCGDTAHAPQSLLSCAPPQSSFGYATNGLVVNFNDQSSGSLEAWAWDFGDGNTTSIASPSHTYSTSGNYLVELSVTDSCGNTATSGQALILLGRIGEFISGISLYPNPGQSHFHLENSEKRKLEAWKLKDGTGREVAEGRFAQPNAATQELHFRPLPAGIYVLELRSGAARAMMKLVIQ